MTFVESTGLLNEEFEKRKLALELAVRYACHTEPDIDVMEIAKNMLKFLGEDDEQLIDTDEDAA